MPLSSSVLPKVPLAGGGELCVREPSALPLIAGALTAAALTAAALTAAALTAAELCAAAFNEDVACDAALALATEALTSRDESAPVMPLGGMPR
ncbi:MAG TPA: hypothetical protein VMG12_07740 [Polyangiaceae bacterium]|nr:hypothetical protein [Polyangiaceae bacterium]